MRFHYLVILTLVLTSLGCRGDQQPKAPSVAELTVMLQSEDAKAQLTALDWVKQLGPAADETTPALAAALKSPDMMVRAGAAMALGQVGPKAADAVPALTQALSDSEYSVRKAAADTLGQLGPAASSAIPALQELSNSGKPDQCGSVNAALKKIKS